jgi:hypothetical protein
MKTNVIRFPKRTVSQHVPAIRMICRELVAERLRARKSEDHTGQRTDRRCERSVVDAFAEVKPGASLGE